MQIADALRQLERVQKSNPLALYVPGPIQLQFHQTAHRRRLIRAGVRAGKTWGGAAEAWWHAIGRHPYKLVPPAPTRGIVLCADWTSYRSAVGRALWDLAPRHLLRNSDWNLQRGWRSNVIELTNGSTIEFRTGRATDSTSVASVEADWAWCDEPPTQDLFYELAGRVANKDGPLWLTATMVGRPVDWLRRHVEGDAEEKLDPVEEWRQFVIPLTTATCPHRTPESIEAQVALYSRWQRAQRVLGDWEGVVDNRLLDGFTESSEDPAVPHLRWSVGLGLDHGERAASEFCVVVLWDPAKKLAWVIDEYVSASRTGTDEDVDGIRARLRERGIAPSEVTSAYGDTNSAGKLGAGRSINDLIGHGLGVEIMKPNKGPGSVEWGTTLLNLGFRRGWLKVHPRCTKLIRSLKNWTGLDDDLKHGVDALRYIATPLLESFLDRGEVDRLRLLRA